MRKILPLLLALTLAGCATAPPPYIGQGPHLQITRGQPIALIDGIGNVLGVLTKLILWNRKMDNHDISAETERYLVQYVDLPQSNTDGTHYSLNEYNPGMALSRLAKNKKVKWPYRILLGIPVTLIVDVLIPGRLFAGLLGGDMYNPYTDTVSIYSDLPSVALHEAGHSHDFNKRRYKGTYAFVRIIPGVDLFQEYKASQQAFKYLIDTGDHPQEIAAYKILYPAFGTYIGAYIPFPGGSLAGALAGHLVGRTEANTKQKQYAQFPPVTPVFTIPASSTTPADPVTTPAPQPEPAATSP